MPTPRQRQSRPAALSLRASCGAAAEKTMAWLVLLAIAMSILSSVTGHADIEGKAKNGVRRAASQLERKYCKVAGSPQLHAITTNIS